MAVLTIRETGLGFLTELPPLEARDGKLTPFDLVNLYGAMLTLIQAFNGEISLGTGEHGTRAGNLDVQVVEVPFGTVANTETHVPHGLDRVISGYWRVRADRACDVYDGNVGNWNNEKFTVKCSVASAVVTLLVW